FGRGACQGSVGNENDCRELISERTISERPSSRRTCGTDRRYGKTTTCWEPANPSLKKPLPGVAALWVWLWRWTIRSLAAYTSRREKAANARNLRRGKKNGKMANDCA